MSHADFDVVTGPSMLRRPAAPANRPAEMPAAAERAPAPKRRPSPRESAEPKS